MPKAKFREGRYGKGIPRVYKFKLGNRKSNISAHAVSSEELIKIYFSDKFPKNKPKIAKVLHLRNVELVAPVEEEIATA